MYPNFSPGPLGIQASFDESVALARGYGYRGVDVSIVELQQMADSHGPERILGALAEAGLQFGVWGLPVNYRGDEAAWRQGLDALPGQAELAQRLGALRTTTFLIPCDDERPFDENFAFHVARLGPVAEILAAHNIRFGLEWVGPKTLRDSRKYPFLHTLEGALQLAQEIGTGNEGTGNEGTGNVGLLVDLFHLYTSHADVSAVRRLTNEQVVNVHVNDAIAGRGPDEQLDNERALPAETGVTDIGGFLQALDAIGYDGPVTVEPFSQRVRAMAPADAAQATAQSLRRSWELAGLDWPGGPEAPA